jgi:LuxR family transcriptional regulator, maltose regulon positive regulatory protein
LAPKVLHMTAEALDSDLRPSSHIRNPRFPSSKFSPPKVASHLVSRSRLHDQLDLGQQRRLTLVVGTAGAGKTVLLADWLSAHPDRPAAWLGCDDADGDPFRFFAAIIEAARRAGGEPGLGEDARQLLGLEGAVSADIVAALADDLEGSLSPQVLVIDDFHLTGPPGAKALALLLEYRPPSLQLVISTRVDPPLRLHRMRASEELVEVRDRDLSFSAKEAKQFLASFDVELDERDVELVHERSEGWAAGLQMAAISIHGSPDPGQAAGRVEIHRHTVAGYFLDEVLYHQPPEVADFMLATSVLDELSVAACTALCGPGSGALLEELYRSHMFVTVVDEQARTYRYHHLVREVLRAELHARDPARERALHAALAGYLADANDVGSAARHLLAAGNPSAAFQLLSERTLRNFSANPRQGSALDLDELEPEIFAGRPEFLVPLATELLLRGAFDRGSRALSLAQHAGVDPARQPDLALKLTVATCMYLYGTGQLNECLAAADRGRELRLDPDGVTEWLAGIEVIAMYCRTFLGDFASARQLAAVVSVSPAATASERDVLLPSVMSQVALFEGELHEAELLAARSLASAQRLGFIEPYYAFCATRTMTLLALERCDLATAAGLVERGLEIAGGGRPLFAYLAQVDRARVWAARGNPEDALASLTPARAALKSEQSPLLAKADELEARLRLALGDVSGAQSTLSRLPDERRMVVSTVIALAAGDHRAASEQLRDAPGRGATIRSDLELRLLRAAIAVVEGSSGAHQLIRQLLAITERYGFLRTVLETAPQVADYLIAAPSGYPAGPAVTSLITARLAERRQTATSPVRTALPDPLTEAEIRVLEKLSERLTYVDIASDLHLSLNTIKTHLRHSYMKLGVSSRSAALERAASLGFI